MTDKNITSLIEEHIPQFIRESYPTFVEFIKTYYEQQDLYGQPYEFIANIQEYMDVDETILEFLEYFSKQYLSTFPVDILPEINQRTVIKHSKEYYSSVGSEASIKFLFRILFNEDIDIYYPTIDILRVSDGKWQNDWIIKVTNSNADDTISGLIGTEIFGETSGARGLVEKVKTYVASNGFEVAELALAQVDPLDSLSKFQAKEFISGTSLDGESFFREEISYILSDIEIINNGNFNAPGDVIEVQSTIGTDAFVIVEQVEAGAIESMEIIEPGTGYAVNDLILFTSTSGLSARSKVGSVGGSGEITSIIMINCGYGYKSMPPYTISSVAGTGARLYPVSSSIGKIKDTKIINFGIGYDPDDAAGFPYTFPISFATAFINGQLEFYKVAYIYDSSWNLIEYVVNETIQGLSSGATARITRIDREAGIIAYILFNVTDFTLGEEIIGLTSTADGYSVYKKFETSGGLLPGPLGNYDGYFANTDGFISSDKYIQDSYYYQDFSYVLTTLRPREEWIDSIKENSHPAGTIVFGFGEGEVLISDYSYGGWIGPVGNSIDFYRKSWDEPTLFDEGQFSEYSNTRLGTIADEVIYHSAYLNPDDYPPEIEGDPINTLYKTNICYGSEVHFNFEGTFHTLIDSVNSLLIDEINELII